MNLSEFQNWSLAQGQVGNPVTPPTFVGQCVSLVQQYLDRVYEIPYQARGNAKDWPTNPDVLSYFNVVSDIQPADIIVYGADYGGGYGHIGIALGNQILDQNGRSPLHVATGNLYTSPSRYVAILRRKGGSVLDIESARILAYYVGGFNGEDGTKNALNGEMDADLNKNEVGQDAQAKIKAWYGTYGEQARNRVYSAYRKAEKNGGTVLAPGVYEVK